MPEGDTVYAAGKRLGAALTGQRLIRGELRHPRLVEQDLAGLTVTGLAADEFRLPLVITAGEADTGLSLFEEACAEIAEGSGG